MVSPRTKLPLKAAAGLKPQAAPRVAEGPKKIVEEFHFKSESAYLCLILNRRTKLIRVIDFRAGELPAKRLFIQSIAKREGIEKVILLVEKDEVSAWTRVGFSREGQVPGFYKRSDGHLIGCVLGDKHGTEVSDDAHRHAERTLNAAKRNLREVPADLSNLVDTEYVDGEDVRPIVEEYWKKQPGLSGFDPFGRDAERQYMVAQAKKGKPNYISSETIEWFGHSYIEVLCRPQENFDVIAITAALRRMTDELKERQLVSALAFAPIDDIGLATAYVAAGFRKTGLLARGIQVGPVRKDAILWTKKLANPAGGDEEE